MGDMSDMATIKNYQAQPAPHFSFFIFQFRKTGYLFKYPPTHRAFPFVRGY